MTVTTTFNCAGSNRSLDVRSCPDEDRVPGRDAVVMLSDEVWQQEFGRDPAVVGRVVRLSGTDFTIVGVTPRTFTGLDLYNRHGVTEPLRSSRLTATRMRSPTPDEV
jgi:hypothetical protein